MTLTSFKSQNDDCDVILKADKAAFESVAIELVILVTGVRLADNGRISSVHLEFECLVICGRVQVNEDTSDVCWSAQPVIELYKAFHVTYYFYTRRYIAINFFSLKLCGFHAKGLLQS